MIGLYTLAADDGREWPGGPLLANPLLGGVPILALASVLLTACIKAK